MPLTITEAKSVTTSALVHLIALKATFVRYALALSVFLVTDWIPQIRIRDCVRVLPATSGLSEDVTGDVYHFTQPRPLYLRPELSMEP